ncbi:MAG: nitroreductase family protein [bacterium]|nr:MAG: nitroreductase family protein [bacterium]
MFKDLVIRNRSYRRFDQSHRVEAEVLEELIELARLTPSTANLQPLKYILSVEPERNQLIFQSLAWAGYLKDWLGPAEGERPSAYIVILRDTDILDSDSCDHGIAAQTILLGAVEKGLGGCMIGNIKRDALAKVLHLPDHLKILLVLALGKPIEEVRLEPVGADGRIQYWRDDRGVHHVPKRGLRDIILQPE